MTISGDQLRIVYKNPCRLATTGAVTLVGGAPNAVDGVSVALNDRILVWQQAAGAENGIYVVTTVGTGADGTWTRASDFNNVANDRIAAGAQADVQEGTTHARARFMLTTTGAITLGVTALTFARGGFVFASNGEATTGEVVESTDDRINRFGLVAAGWR
jgi:hypothetical protein